MVSTVVGIYQIMSHYYTYHTLLSIRTINYHTQLNKPGLDEAHLFGNTDPSALGSQQITTFP